MKEKAKLKIHQKRILSDFLILEIKLWEVTKTKKYPDSIRYRIILVDLKKRKRFLMDNHTPKGHHYHLDDQEFKYEYSGTPQLIKDFYSLSESHLGVKL